MSEFAETTEQLEILKRAYVEMKTMRTRLDHLERVKTEPIAIVGMSCRFPGGVTDLQSYWKLLQEGRDAIVEIPADRWDINAYYDSNPAAPGKMYTRWGGFLDQVDQFDPTFFGIAPREAASMDPQQRLLLETCWEALEHANEVPSHLVGSRTGVFIGISSNDYSQLDISSDLSRLSALTGTGGTYCTASGRISYLLGLQGPNFPVDTACSSSLVTVHLACQALRNEECRLALAGGVNLILSPSGMVFFSRMRAMADDGRCKTFDARANGYVRGEGCGIVALKRLSDALTDGNPILALIRGSAVNHNGHSNGLSAPNGRAQEAVIRQALDAAQLKPAQIDYIEAHGTGTALGDPIEVRALGAVLSEGHTVDNPFVLGSVKTNVGHLEAAAGIAGLIKAVLALQHEQIPSHLHFQKPSHLIPWESIPVVVPTTNRDWPARPDRQRYAGVSAFGMGGTNAHIVLEEAPVQTEKALLYERPWQILCLSAKNEAALQESKHRYQSYLSQHPDVKLADVCYTANSRRTLYAHRMAFIASSPNQMLEHLSAPTIHEAASLVATGHIGKRAPRIAFLFTGQGAQYSYMGQQLYETQPVFHDTLDRCARLLDPLIEKPLLSVLYGKDYDVLDETRYTQPALFALEYALAQLWKSWGVEPQLVLGHSVGEYTAACIAGLFSLEDGIRLIAERGRLMHSIQPAGTMLAVQASADIVETVVAECGGLLSIAAYNGPQDLVISGTHKAIDAARAQFEKQGIKTRTLQVSQAFHSPLMDTILSQWESVTDKVLFRAPHIDMVSNISGKLTREKELEEGSYWKKHLREPVRFAQSMQTVHEQGIDILVEIGPQPTLLGMGKKSWPEGEGVWVPTLRKGKTDWEQMLSGVGQLFVRGVQLDWEQIDGFYARSGLTLPTYPFQRQQYWIDQPESPGIEKAVSYEEEREEWHHPVLGRRIQSSVLQDIIFEKQFTTRSLPLLQDHIIKGAIIAAGAHHIAMALSAAAEIADARVYELAHMTFSKPLLITTETGRKVQLIVRHQSDTTMELQLLSLEEEDTWALHATGKLHILTAQHETPLFDQQWVASLQTRCSEEMPDAARAFYKGASEIGLQFGPTFRWLERVWYGNGEARCQLRSPQIDDHVERYQLHPGLLDSCIQLLSSTFLDNGSLYLPIGFNHFHFYGMSKTEPLWSYVLSHTKSQENQETCSGDIFILDNANRLVASIEGLHFKRTSQEALQSTLAEQSKQIFYQTKWQPRALAQEGEPLIGTWLLCSPPTGEGELARTIVQQLREQGAQVDELPLTQTTDWQQHMLTRQAVPRGILLLFDYTEQLSLETNIEQMCSIALNALQKLIQYRPEGNERISPRLWLMTRGTTSPSLNNQSPSTEVTLAHTALWGLGRVIAREHPKLWGGLIDLPADGSAIQEIRQLVAELGIALKERKHQSQIEDQIAFYKGQRYVARLQELNNLPVTEISSIQSDKTYLITGAFGALGQLLARWLVKRGASHLVLLRRQAMQAKDLAFVEDLQNQGVQVLALSTDVAQKEEVTHLFTAIEQAGLPPLRGIIHAAGTLDDGVLLHQNAERFQRVLAPKIAGAWYLHQQTQTIPLDWFVLFSSVAASLGSPGQGSYAAANAFLDGLAHYRQSRGLPGLSINWGPWAGLGMSARVAAHNERSSRQGLIALEPEEGIYLLERLLDAQQAHHLPAQIAIMRFQPEWLASMSPGQAIPALWTDVAERTRPALFTENKHTPIVQRNNSIEIIPLTSQIVHALPQEQPDIVRAYIVKQTNIILGFTDDESIDPQRPLSELGLDSLMALDLTKLLEKGTGLSFPATLLFDYPTIEELTSHLLKQIVLPETTEANTSDATIEDNDESLLEKITQLSDDEADALLAQTLADLEN